MRTLIVQYLPLLAVCLLLKGVRTKLLLPEPTPTLPLMESLLHELGLHAVAVGVVCLLLSLRQSRATEIAAQLGLGAVALGAIVLELIALLFAWETGLALDHHLFLYVLSNFAMVLPVIFSEVDPNTALSLAILATALVGFRAWQIASQRVEAVAKRAAALLTLGGLVVLALPTFTVARSSAAPMPVALTVGPFLRPVEISREPALPPHSASARLRELPAGDAPRYDHVAIVALESTGYQASSLSPGGPETTPFLRSLEERSLSFPHAYAVVPHSSKAIVAIACGIVPYLRMEVRETEAVPVRCLPSLLGDSGFASLYLGSHTGAFEQRRALTRNMGFQKTVTLEDLDPRGYEPVNYLSLEDDALLPSLERFLSSHRDGRSFVFVLTSAGHHDYQTTSRYPLRDFSPRETQNRYLNNLYYQDRFLEKFMARYREAGLIDRTLFVVLGDHGEAFGEHGRDQHDAVMYEEVMRVPLILNATGIEARREEALVSQLDILPTIVELLGFEIVDGSYDGVELARRGPDSVAFGACWYSERCLTRITRQRKIVSHLDHQPPEAFALHADPRETRDLFGQEPDDEARHAELRAWKAQQLGRYQNFLDRRDASESAP